MVQTTQRFHLLIWYSFNYFIQTYLFNKRRGICSKQVVVLDKFVVPIIPPEVDICQTERFCEFLRRWRLVKGRILKGKYIVHSKLAGTKFTAVHSWSNSLSQALIAWSLWDLCEGTGWYFGDMLIHPVAPKMTQSLRTGGTRWLNACVDGCILYRFAADWESH